MEKNPTALFDKSWSHAVFPPPLYVQKTAREVYGQRALTWMTLSSVPLNSNVPVKYPNSNWKIREGYE